METKIRLSRPNKFISAENITIFSVSSDDYLHEVHTISLQTFVVRAFKIVVDSWKFSILLLYISWDDWSIFMISDLNEQLQQKLEYTLIKPDCHSW